MTRQSLDGAGDARAAGRPVEVERFAAEHVESDRTEVRETAIETVVETIADDEERSIGHFCGWKRGGRIVRADIPPDEVAARSGRIKGLAVDEDGAVGAWGDEIARESDNALDEESVG